MSQISGGEVRAPRLGPGRFGWSQRHVDSAIVINLSGELDLSTAAPFGQRLMKVAEWSTAATIVLDFSDVRFIDAHSIGLIVSAWAAAKRRGRQLHVDGLHGTPALLFGVLGLEPLLAHRMWEEKAEWDAGAPKREARRRWRTAILRWRNA